MSLVTGLFFLVLLLNQRWSLSLRLQASHCSTFRIMCDVPSIAVFCCESIECFPGTSSKFFLKLLVTIKVAPIITGIIVHCRFHIRCISIHKLLYFNFVCGYCHIYQCCYIIALFNHVTASNGRTSLANATCIAENWERSFRLSTGVTEEMLVLKLAALVHDLHS